MANIYDIKQNGFTIRCADFDSFIDQYHFIKDFIKEDRFGTVKEVNKKDDFYGLHSLRNTIDGMSYGFQEATDYFLDVIADIKSSKDASNGIYMDYQGYAYDMGSVVNGVPECCINSGTPTPTPCIKIMVDITFSWSYSQKEIYNRGVAITNLINTLLINGFIVDLCVVELNHQFDMDVLYTVKIDTNTLSIANIAFMCSPEYFRKIGFITVDCIRNKESNTGRGMSLIYDFMLKKIQKEKIFFIGGSYNNKDFCNYLNNIEETNDYILKMFKKYCEENEIELTIEDIKDID